PGVLTRTLLNAGVRVVALESHPAFLSELQSLENSLDGQLKVIYGDFFRLDPLVTGAVKPPAVCSDKLFEAMGIAAVPWGAGMWIRSHVTNAFEGMNEIVLLMRFTYDNILKTLLHAIETDVPVKIFGIFPQRKERNTLWRLLFILYECSSIYRYGRVELNVFISEKEYKVCARDIKVRGYFFFVMKQVRKALHFDYSRIDDKCFSKLSQSTLMPYCICSLSKEPWSSFLTNMKSGRLAIPRSTRLPNDHLCLVRLTPQQNLFTGGLKPANSATFIFMVKQCLTKPRSKLIDRL
ncbi:hypothetical protein CIB84_013178, partial [Bambusicola thoracicus]